MGSLRLSSCAIIVIFALFPTTKWMIQATSSTRGNENRSNRRHSMASVGTTTVGSREQEESSSSSISFSRANYPIRRRVKKNNPGGGKDGEGNDGETRAGSGLVSDLVSEDTPPSLSCQSDKDCLVLPGYCSAGTCRSHGKCSDIIDCFNPSNIYPVIECVGYLTCNQGMCGRVCDSPCKDGSNFVNCLVSPCDNPSASCLAELPVSCMDDYCGGCNAIRFNAMGSQVCKAITPGCSSDSDCELGEEYCSGGTCRTRGTCGDLVDCFNPSNVFMDIKCMGYMTCDDQGMCQRVCSGSPCPIGSSVADCAARPCDIKSETCLDEGAISCADNYCGGCNAIHFDAMGSQVCTTAARTVFSCTSNSDCQGNEYCSAGTCRTKGECGDVVDCFNPSNAFATILCVGYLTCDRGMCETVCSDSSCPDTSDIVKCSASPCNVTASDDCLAESPISCVDNYCGGCNAIRFNANGTQVCKPAPVSPTIASCTSNTDCQGDEYCSGGTCRTNGECRDVVDCLNPSNKYFTVMCLGYLKCEEERCGMVCSSSTCADGSKPVSCKGSPCAITKDDCLTEVACVDDYCGGCNAYHFDSAGNRVCQ